MSRSGEVTLSFGAEERVFRLAIGQWRKIQELCDAGPAELLARLAPPFQAMGRGVPFATVVGSSMLGRWRIDDVRAVILHGLIGGGMDPAEAGRLVREWVDERPMLEPIPVAYQIIFASMCGTEDEDASGEPAGETGPPLFPEESSASAKTATTPSARRSGSRRAKSTSSASGS